MTRRLLPVLALVPTLALTACGDGGRLTAQGSVGVTTGDATRRFEFPSETRLDGTGPGRFTGTCTIRRMHDDAGGSYWGVTVEVRSGGTAPGDDFPLQRVTVVQNSGAAPGTGAVEVELGGTLLKTVDGACAVELEYVQDGMVGFGGSCQVADAEGVQTAQVALDLDVAGCTVEQ